MGRNVRPLGIHAKSAAGQGAPDAKMPAPGTVFDDALKGIYALQRHIAGVLNDKHAVIRGGISVAAFDFRVAMCHRGTDGGTICVKRSPNHQRAAFGGLQQCGSVWHCPICAPKIANRRRDEMSQALYGWKIAGGAAGFVTVTFSHQAAAGGQGGLAAQLERFTKALRSLKGLRGYKDMMKRAGSIGSIAALEVTYGEFSGWHPHKHEIVFMGADGLRQLRQLRRLWARVLLKAGLGGIRPGDTGAERFGRLRALLRHCCTVQDGSYAADYIAKFGRDVSGWSITDELAKPHLKQKRSTDGAWRRCGHASPWELAADSMAGDRRSRELFREYALAFQGKRQIVWSAKLKARFYVEELEDEVISRAADETCSEHVIEIMPEDWSVILAHDGRWQVLYAAAQGGRAGVEALIGWFRGRPDTHSGEFSEDDSFFLPMARAG